MTRHNQVAKSVRENKEQHPECYCPARQCLWKTAEVGPNGEYILNADPCQKHPELNVVTARRVREYTEREQLLISKGRQDLGPIRGKLAIHNAEDDSDATLERILGQCVGAPWLIPAAKLLRGEGVALVGPKALAEDTFARIERSNAAQEAYARRL